MKTNFSKYADRPISSPGVVNHDFVDASKSGGQYTAEEANRQAVTARWLFEHPDVHGYLYAAGDTEGGLDPWRQIEGVDASRDSTRYFIQWGRTGEKEVDENFVVFAPRKEVEAEIAQAHEERLDRNPRTKAALDIPMSGEFVDYRTRQVIALTEASLRLEEERRRLVEALRLCDKVLKTPVNSRNKPAGTSEGTATRAIDALLRELGEES